jgi:Flp pilus assembly protein TadB
VTGIERGWHIHCSSNRDSFQSTEITETSGLKEGDNIMLWTIIVVLLVLWLLGFFAFGVTSPLIHLIIVVAVVILVINLLTGRRTV